jgi:hypothetical protein
VSATCCVCVVAPAATPWPDTKSSILRQVRARACVIEAAERWRAAASAARPASPAAAVPALRWLNPQPRASLCRASYEPSADSAASQPCGAVAFSRSAVGGLEVRVACSLEQLGRNRKTPPTLTRHSHPHFNTTQHGWTPHWYD